MALQIDKPLEKLPQEYDVINQILNNMKINNNGHLKNNVLVES